MRDCAALAQLALHGVEEVPLAVACDVDHGFAVNGETVRLLVLTLLASRRRQPSVREVANNGILLVCLCK